MAETLEPSRWHRLRHTPLRDVVLGRVTGRLDVQALLATAELSPEERALIERVVRRTRLWRLEKVDVARELIAHFLDGLEAGHTPEEMIASFGDERRAATLIRRAKKRQRPIAWHVWRYAFWCGVAVVALYGAVAAQYFLGRPTPSVDYLPAVTAEARAAAAGAPAWPLYRQALEGLALDELTRREDEAGIANEQALLRHLAPSDARWGDTVAFLRKHKAELAVVRQAGAMDGLGYVPSHEIAEEDQRVLGPQRPDREDLGLFEDSLVGVMLPHLSQLRRLARLTSADARLAASEGDGERALADVVAIAGMARHAGEVPTLINGLVGISISALNYELIGGLLHEHPDLWSDVQLRDLAHRLAVADPGELLRIEAERLSMRDTIQRVFTDDGDGDGYLTAQGMRAIRPLYAQSDPYRLAEQTVCMDLANVAAQAWVPAVLLTSATRRETLAEAERVFDELEAALRVPLRDQPFEADELMATGEWGRRYPLLRLMLPALGGVRVSAERVCGAWEGTLVAIARELHRRRHGAYPATLQDLVPSLLPEVPRDRITGEAVRYRVDEGVPVVYSVGADRDDDGGAMIYDRDGDPAVHLAARWGVPVDRADDGDWVLWPQGGAR